MKTNYEVLRQSSQAKAWAEEQGDQAVRRMVGNARPTRSWAKNSAGGVGHLSERRPREDEGPVIHLLKKGTGSERPDEFHEVLTLPRSACPFFNTRLAEHLHLAAYEQPMLLPQL